MYLHFHVNFRISWLIYKKLTYLAEFDESWHLNCNVSSELWMRCISPFFCCSVTKSCLTLWDPMEHAKTPCPSSSPWVCSNSCPLSQWCHPTISSSVVPFSSCLPSFPASGSFQMRQFFTSGGQSIGASASASVLPTNIQDWFPLGLTGWISLQSKGPFKSLLQHHSLKASILQHSAFFMVQLSHPHMTTGKTIALTICIFVGKVTSLLLNMLSRFVIAFLPRSKRLLILWLQSLWLQWFWSPKK